MGVLVAAAACSGSVPTDGSGSGALKSATIVALKPNSLYSKAFAQVANLAPGESSPLLATGYAAGAFVGHTQFYDSLDVDQAMTWTSRSPEIATIDGAGVVTGRSLGMATIVVQSRGGLALDSGAVIVQQPALRLVALIPGRTMCGLGDDGGAWCWGYSANPANPPTAASLAGTRFPAVASGGTKKYTSLAASDAIARNACGIATDGITYCWAITSGATLFGAPVVANTPVPFAPDLRFTTLRMGGGSACGLTREGALYCWGDNYNGQLGDGTKVTRTTPTLVAGGLSFTDFTTGFVSCGISVDGGTYCWGYGEKGALGDGRLVSSSLPVKVATTEKFVEVRASFYHTCGRTLPGEVFCWGDNSRGQLGDGTTSNHSSPLRIADRFLFSSLSVDNETTCGVTTDGKAVCWGAGGYGTVGDGTFTFNRAMPTLVSGNLRFTSVAGGDERTCGQSSGVWYCWGDNTTGNMGINRMSSVNVPTRLAGVLP